MSKNKNTKKNNRRKKKRSFIAKIILVIFEILLLAVLGIGAYAVTVLNKITVEEMTTEEAGINTDLESETIETLEGYTNIALFGLDNRGSNQYQSGNSDTIMIASINNATKEVKLVSVYRDTYLNVGNGYYRKANNAYATGGAKGAVQMLNSNLDLDITEYVCVDWCAMVEAIDILGGVDIEITSGEAKEINECIVEIDQATGKKTPKVSGSGWKHLDGTQATAYARIRSLAGDDFMRASRQRIVLEAMLNKAKTADLATLNTLCNEIMGDITTSLTLPQLLDVAKSVADYSIVATSGFPFELTTRMLSSTGSTVIPITLETNVTQLHSFLFGNTSYTPSKTVSTLSGNIAKKTGTSGSSSTVDTDKYNDTTGAGGTGQVGD